MPLSAVGPHRMGFRVGVVAQVRSGIGLLLFCLAVAHGS